MEGGGRSVQQRRIHRWLKQAQKCSIVAVIVLLALANVVLITRDAPADDQIQQVKDEHRSRRSADEGPQAGLDRGGAMFIRWGRSECPKEDQLVYAGSAGGSLFSHTGGASNYICLPQDPIFGEIIAGVQNQAMVYGAEYQLGANKHGSFSSANAPSLHDHNVPCAVCRSYDHATALMIPARSQCYDSWHMEYHGYLMAGYHGHKSRTEYVCVDREPEADAAGYRNEDGVLFYQVESVCGSLPCPPYDNGKELTCVVCTK